MTQIAEPFEHYSPGDGPSIARAEARIPVSILADRAHVRDMLVERVVEAGLSVRQAEGLDRLVARDPFVLGDLVLVDVPAPDGAVLAALARLDSRAARGGTQLIVSTLPSGIDAVFGVMDSAQVQFLVDPAEADRALALGTALARLPGRSVQEMSREEQLTLVRLTEQVHMLASRLGPSDTVAPPQEPAVMHERTVTAFSFAGQTSGRAKGSSGNLPDPAIVRNVIRMRGLRSRFFDAQLFADPAWDMLLDLTAATGEGREVSVSSLCIASGVPPTTALRWIAQMTSTGLLERVPDSKDRRRAIIHLSDQAREAMTRFFAAAESPEMTH